MNIRLRRRPSGRRNVLSGHAAALPAARRQISPHLRHERRQGDERRSGFPLHAECARESAVKRWMQSPGPRRFLFCLGEPDEALYDTWANRAQNDRSHSECQGRRRFSPTTIRLQPGPRRHSSASSFKRRFCRRSPRSGRTAHLCHACRRSSTSIRDRDSGSRQHTSSRSTRRRPGGTADHGPS